MEGKAKRRKLGDDRAPPEVESAVESRQKRRKLTLDVYNDIENVINELQEEVDSIQKTKHVLKNRFDRILELTVNFTKQGDALLTKINTVFHLGLGLKWSPVQTKCFTEVVNAALPLIYGNHWNAEKPRVMLERGIKKIQYEILLNLSRRNGKTFVTSGVTATFLLTIPGVSFCIFSVSERQSKLLKEAVDAMINTAWQLGTHVKKDDFAKIETNKETWSYKMLETNTIQKLSALPGSSKVILYFSFLFYLFMLGKHKKCWVTGQRRKR